MQVFNEQKLQEIIKFSPHENQLKILESQEREIVVCAGRRFGKSLVASYLALKSFLQPNKTVWIVVPFYGLGDIIFENVIVWISRIFSPENFSKCFRVYRRPYPKIRSAQGSYLEIKSAENPTAMLGRPTDLTIVDEAARIPSNIWEQYLFPATHDRAGRAIFISTPFGKSWFYHLFLKTKAAFQFKSIDNPHFSKEEWERARNSLPERIFKQEYLAAFLDDAATVFRGIREIVSSNSLEEPQPSHRYILGVDLAKYQDFTVLTCLDEHTHKVVFWDRFKDIYYPLQKARIINTALKYNKARIIIDSTGIGDPISDDLRKEGFLVEDFQFTGKSKFQLIDKLSIFIEQKAITIPNQDELINELESYTYHLTDYGNVRYSAPSGYHDDSVISLALAVWGLFSTQKRPQIPIAKVGFERFKFEYR